MNLFRNQKGLTLVELLGAFTLLFIIAGLAFVTLGNSLQLFERESNRINVRQEVNIIANQLTTFYQQNGDFTVSQEGDGVRIESMARDGNVVTREYSLSGHKITISYLDSETERFAVRDITINVTGDEEFTLNTAVSRIR